MSTFGKPNYEGRNTKNYFEIDDGDNVFRILPPYGSLSEKGKWIQYYSVVWGYTDSKDKKRPFSDNRVVDFKTKMVNVESAAYVKAKKIEDAYNALLNKSKEEDGKNPETERLVKDLYDQKRKYNIENKHYVNAMNLQGEVGLLKMGARAKEQLVELVKKLNSEGTDALSLDNGRFFNFNRIGKGRDTQYTVSVYKEKIETKEHGIVEKEKVSKITEGEISRIAKEAFDLGTLFVTPTVEQMERIVLKKEPVDIVLGLKTGNSSITATPPAADQQPVADSNPVEDIRSLAANAGVSNNNATASDIKEQVKTPPSAGSSLTPKTSDEDILKMLGELGI